MVNRQLRGQGQQRHPQSYLLYFGVMAQKRLKKEHCSGKARVCEYVSSPMREGERGSEAVCNGSLWGLRKMAALEFSSGVKGGYTRETNYSQNVGEKAGRL